MEGSLGLLEHKLVGASHEDGDSLVLRGAAGDLDDSLVGASGDFFDEVSGSKLLGGELINMRDGDSVDGLADEVDVVALNVLDDHDVLLGEEMEGEVVDGITEDGFLDHEHIAAGSNNLFDQADDVLLLLLEDAVHGSVVIDHHVVLQVGLGGGQAELDQTNLSLFLTGGATGEVGHLVVGEAQSVDELGIVDSAAKLHGNLDVVQVDVGVGLVNDLKHSVHSHRGQDVGVLGHNL
mmetsp:Transcript_2008/g.2991  ORF Transcript_2008/g.2991 Transcript_2008/m.2991 type:complete len:236 (+) Transcript_2008:430-1137(+)